MACEDRMISLIPQADHIPLSIGDIFDDRGRGVIPLGLRQPKPSGKPCPVGHRDPAMFNFFYRGLHVVITAAGFSAAQRASSARMMH